MRNDSELAHRISSSLLESGNSVFCASNSAGHDNFAENIKHVIQECSYFIVLLTQDVLNGGIWVEREIEMALEAKRIKPNLKIIPLNIDGSFEINNLSSLPHFLEEFLKCQWMNFNTSNFSDSMEKLQNIIMGGQHPKRNSSVKDGNASEIFVAYKREDIDDVKFLIETLKEYGYENIWYDLDGISAGEPFELIIKQAVEDCKVFIAILSDKTERSEWFNKELELAKLRRKQIVYVWGTGINKVSYAYKRKHYNVNELHSVVGIRTIVSALITQKVLCNTKMLDTKVENVWSLNRNSVDSFCRLLEAYELGSPMAASELQTGLWSIDMRKTVASYCEFVKGSILSFAEDIYRRGVFLADDPTLTDSSVRGRGMEKSAFRMMKRAIDLGYDGESPESYSWSYLTQDDFEQAYKDLGASSLRLETVDLKNNNVSIPASSTPRIFISHKNDDKPIVIPLVEKIEKSTNELCWIDLEGIESDAQFVDVICKAINDCDVFLFMYTQRVAATTDFQSDWMSREINYAEKRHKRIVIVNMDRSSLNDHYELLYGTKQQVDIHNEVRLKKLFSDLKKWLNQ